MFFFQLNFCSLLFDVHADELEKRHVHVGNPHHGKTTNEITAPVGIDQGVVGDHQHEDDDVMTEAIFAREEKEKFPGQEGFAVFAFADQVLMQFTENIFMSKCPGDAGNWNRENEK